MLIHFALFLVVFNGESSNFLGAVVLSPFPAVWSLKELLFS